MRLPEREEPLSLLVIRGLGQQPLMVLLLAVLYFAACVLDTHARLWVMARYVEGAAKRVFGIPDFKYYLLADGIPGLLACSA